MITALCCAIAVLVAGVALQPSPVPRALVDDELDPPTPRRRALRRRRQALVAAPDEVAIWCEGLARAIRSGSSLPTAIRTTSPPASCQREVDRLKLALDRGMRLADALREPVGSRHLQLAVGVIRACAINGGPAAEPLDRAAATLRARAAHIADRQTHSAQARLSAIVMTLLPVAMLVLLLATSTTTRRAVLTAPGALTVMVGGALNVAGWQWMRRVIGGESP